MTTEETINRLLRGGYSLSIYKRKDETFTVHRLHSNPYKRGRSVKTRGRTLEAALYAQLDSPKVTP